MKLINLRKITSLLIIFLAAGSLSFAATTYGCIKINGKWIYGALISDKGTIDNGDGTITVYPPWSFVSEDGETIIGSFNEIGNFEWKYTNKPIVQDVKVKIEIMNSSGVTIRSDEPFFVELYEVKTGKKVLESFNETVLNIKPKETLKISETYIMRISDTEGNQKTVQFIIGEDSVLKSDEK